MSAMRNECRSIAMATAAAAAAHLILPYASVSIAIKNKMADLVRIFLRPIVISGVLPPH
mgnify:FL=1